MIHNLNYNQKVIALSLLHKCILTDAIQVFGNTFGFNTKDARETLTHVQRTAVIVQDVIVEKRGTELFVLGKSGAWDTSEPVSDEFLNKCPSAKRRSLEKAIDMLKERKFSTAA